MLKKQRQKIILDYLQEHQFGRVEVLNELTGSSAITTRRDINELDALGLLEKVYGGAQRLHTEKQDITVAQRLGSHHEQKEKIAKMAVKQITSGALIYLDAGSTVHAMIPFLKGLDVKVFTHGIHHVELLTQLEIDTYLIGGHVKGSTLASTGSSALETIAKMSFDIAFMGTNAVDPEFGFSTPDVEEAAIKSRIIEQSNQCFVLADRTKFNKKSHVQFGEASLPVITDYDGSENLINMHLVNI